MTARDYAQTLAIARMQGLEPTQIGKHGGAGRLSKGWSLVSRTREMKRYGRDRHFDLAIGLLGFGRLLRTKVRVAEADQRLPLVGPLGRLP